MVSDEPQPARADTIESDEAASSLGAASDSLDTVPAGREPEARLEDALERVAHGAVVSVSAILIQQGLTVGFTVLLTNGFAARSYGLFALARRLQQYLAKIVLGFRQGLSRFLPNTTSTAERDMLATFASLLLMGVATVVGAGLFIATPLLTRVIDQGQQFQRFLRVFAIGLPASVWLSTITEILRSLEEVGPFNLALRVGFPAAQLLVGVIGVVVFHDLVLIAGGVVFGMGLVGVATAGWLVYDRGLSPQLRGVNAAQLRGRYLQFTLPLFVGGIAATTQRLGFYPLIALFLPSVAAGVFAVGVLLGTLVRLPLRGINQFIPPVAAALHEQNHRNALRRLYHVTSRLVLMGTTALTIPIIVYREVIMGVFGPTFVTYAHLLPGFIVAQYAACAAGSVGILLVMTDHQRAVLVVDIIITVFLAGTAVPLTMAYGLPGLVASYFLMLAVNNSLQVAVLYYLEGFQPFTRLHATPLVAAVPLLLVAQIAHLLLPETIAPLVGTLSGLLVYIGTLHVLGVTRVERRLALSLLGRYRKLLPNRNHVRT